MMRLSAFARGCVSVSWLSSFALAPPAKVLAVLPSPSVMVRWVPSLRVMMWPLSLVT